MAIFDRSYRVYAGELTPVSTRFLVPARYALEDAFKSRLFMSFFLLASARPRGCVFYQAVLHGNRHEKKQANQPLERREVRFSSHYSPSDHRHTGQQRYDHERSSHRRAARLKSLRVFLLSHW